MEESHGYDVNSAAGLTIICPKSNRMVLALRSPDSGNEPNTWCGFGGMMQNAETPLQAAKRETMEESEIEPDTVLKESFFVDQNVPNTPPGFKFYNFLAILEDELKPTINDEHSIYKWYRIPQLYGINLHSGVKRMLEDPKSIHTLKQYLGF